MSFVVYPNESLVPESWRGGGAARAFNPTLARVEGGYAMCYRVVQLGEERRRFACCRLDEDLQLIEGSVVALSDEVTFRDPDLNERSLTWHADPRYLRLGGRLHLIWNDGANRPVNRQFLAPMTDDGCHFAGEARELTTPNRRTVEKNWAPFEVDGQIFITYKSRPHVVLGLDLDEDALRLVAEPRYQSGFSSDYEFLFGILRGGAQPVRDGDDFLVLGHSSFSGANGRTYRAAFMRFSASAPFEVTAMSKVPFDLPNEYGASVDFARLNQDVGDVVYPCGLVADGEDWVVSYGINDERCAVARVQRAAIEATMTPLKASFSVRQEAALPARPVGGLFGRRKVEPLVPPATAEGKLPLFWYDALRTSFDGSGGRRVFKVGNFGDIASKAVVEKITGAATIKPIEGRPRLLAIGSVLHRAKEGDVVWGSGVKGGTQPLPEGLDLTVAAVRGPHSIDFLQGSGIDTSRVTELFDPGCLLPHLFAEEIAAFEPRGGDRIIPHYRDDLAMRRRHYDRLDDFVSVDRTPLNMIKQIVGADRVFSSSLHGIIFAESLGIPAYWLAPLGGENELKYYDYYYGTDRHQVKRFETLDEALRSDPMPLPTFRPEAYLATFPEDALAELRFQGVRPGQRVDLLHFDTKGLGNAIAVRGFDLRDHRGLWITDQRASLATTLRAEPGELVHVAVTLRPFNPAALPEPQAIKVSANGGEVTVVEWKPAKRDSLEVVLEVRAEAHDTPLVIDVEAGTAVSPRALGVADIEAKVAGVVTGLRFSTADKPAKAGSASGV